MQGETQLDYGPVRADEIDVLNGLLEQALTFQVGTMAPWTQSIGHANVRAVRRNGRTVAGMGVIPMGHYIGGRVVRTGGVTPVGVAPDQRGSGVGLWMMRQSLEEMHDQGLPISTLYPATTAFYRRAGYERAAQRIIYEVPIAAMGVRDYRLEAIPAGPAEYDTIKRIYAQQAERISAMIDRPDFYWNMMFEPKDKPAYKFIVQREGVPEGYVIFFHAAWNDPLVVRDIVALTPAAGRRLLTLLADHRSMIETARIPGGPNDPLLFQMAEQKHKVWWALDLMLRIVDVAAALEARGYPPGMAAELHLDVRDDLLPWNQGRWVMHIADRQGHVRPGGQGRIGLHIRDLAALYTGHLTPLELSRAGTLEGPEADLAQASLAFGGARPWTPDMF